MVEKESFNVAHGQTEVYVQKSCTYLNNLKVTGKILELFRSRIEKKEFLLYQFST